MRIFELDRLDGLLEFVVFASRQGELFYRVFVLLDLLALLGRTRFDWRHNSLYSQPSMLPAKVGGFANRLAYEQGAWDDASCDSSWSGVYGRAADCQSADPSRIAERVASPPNRTQCWEACVRVLFAFRSWSAGDRRRCGDRGLERWRMRPMAYRCVPSA